ncbi:MaoC family dehydratase N-terminal domain-containing protein [Nocardioides zeae]|uniref:MaoC family dehydratase N-terminal domain-containing protein n=1 Tax=Nocardioides imazamoxiresistens TaxID=3231893 RepID=A0ABU3PTI3_9ACTN|nr:MaoC family dehydratase N-terminal domain-containing protein [Nocardioides zeae]MDT9592152.1 MaoC family dehydratase N-terminal domain-containing protein [Nocardioides zeae]
MEQGTLVNDEMRAALGDEIDWRTSYPVDASDLRRWSIAVHYPEAPPRRFLNAEHYGGLVAPDEFNPFAWQVARRRRPVVVPKARDTDRPEKVHGIRGPGLRHQVAGGIEATYGESIRVGDVVTSRTRLVAYVEKQGRLGPMLLTTTEDRWTNQDGAFVRLLRETSIRYDA